MHGVLRDYLNYLPVHDDDHNRRSQLSTTIAMYVLAVSIVAQVIMGTQGPKQYGMAVYAKLFSVNV